MKKIKSFGQVNKSDLKNLAHGVSQLVSSAKKAMHSMNRRCALLPISDPGLRCKLFDSLVLPILSYASEVWAVDEKIGDAAELLHRQFLKHLLGVRDSTANVIVLAELGRFLLVKRKENPTPLGVITGTRTTA